MNKSSTEVPEELRLKLADFLNKVREEKNIGFNQLSLKSEVNPGVLTKILNGTNKRINPYQLMKLAAALKVDYKELYKIVGYLEEEVEKRPITSNAKILDIDLEAIPVFSSVAAGCGNEPAEIVDYLVLPGVSSKDHFAVKVEGDSMETTIPNGRIILVKRNEPIDNGRVGVFIISDGAVVKRIQRHEKMTMLTSDNSDYSPIIIGEGDIYHECGKVVMVLPEKGEL